jgi:CRISPR system Cascade subunit CasB
MNEKAFIAHLTKLARPEAGDRAALAALRRSLDEETASFAGAAPHVVRFLSADSSQKQERIAYLIGGLFALHSDIIEQNISFASVLKRISDARDSDSLELRFSAMLKTSAEDLPTHLRHAVSLARSEGQAIPWARLLHDLLRWDHPDGYIQRRWARDYWSQEVSEKTDVSVQKDQS